MFPSDELTPQQQMNMERWARALDGISTELLDKDKDFNKVDTSRFFACPYCNSQPRAWISKGNASGIVRCCVHGSTIVTIDKVKEPVTSTMLEIAWNKLVWHLLKETNHAKQ